MDPSPRFVIKQEENVEEFADGVNLLDLGFDIKVKVENASPRSTDEADWCVDNSELFQNNNYFNVYDDLIECTEQECMTCHKKFDDLYTLLQHNITHMKIMLTSCLDQYQHQCNGCDAYFQRSDKLKAHEKRCTKSSRSVKIVNKKYQCNVCRKFLPYKTWHSHIREVHNTDKVTCDLCKREFKCHKYLRRHIMFKHDGVTPSWRFHKIQDVEVKCQQCPAILKNKGALRVHNKNCHSSSEATCSVCQAKFKSEPYLRTHMYRVHDGDGKKYFCVCGKSYRSPRRLRIHKKNAGCGNT